MINYRLLDWDKGINQINEFNFVNLTKEKTSTLIKWAREINNLKKERSGLAFISFLINKIKRINKYKLIFKYSNFLYYLGLKDRLFYPKTILINCNNICNFNCSFCINKDTRTLLFKEQDFSLKDLNKIISEISAFNPYICITGGEPLLNKEIFKIIYTLKKNGIKRVELLTNGFLIKKYFSELILSGLDTITISLDHYLSEKHDEIRGVKGAFNSLLEGLILLRDFKNKYGDVININITTVINKENYKDLANMYDFIEKIGLINVWQIRHLVYLNENNFFLQKKQKNNQQIPINNVIGFLHKNDYFSKDELDILKEQLKIIKLKSFFNKTKLVVAPNKIDIDKYYSNFEFSKNRICKDIFESIQIKNGKISTRCDYILGDLTGGILKTWNSKKNLNFLSYIKENGLPQCWRCTRRNYS